MALQTLNTIKDWFKTGLKPSQTQFWDTWDSFRHKNDKVPVAEVDGLDEIIDSKADKMILDNHLTDDAAHADLFNDKEDKTQKGAPDGYAPLDEFTKLAAQYLNIVNDLVTGGAESLLSAEQGKVLQMQVNAINNLLTSDNMNLDTLQELVDAVETVQASLGTILVNDLTTGGITKALTAEMGKQLDLIKENTANKSTSIVADYLSNIKFPSVKAVYDFCMLAFRKKFLVFGDVAGITHTFGAGAENTMFKFSNNNPITATIPTNATTPFDIGTVFETIATGNGALTVTGAPGVTILTNLSNTSVKNEVRRYTKIDIDTWAVEGNRNKISELTDDTGISEIKSENVFYLRGNGNDNTARVGSRTYPFATIDGLLTKMATLYGYEWNYNTKITILDTGTYTINLSVGYLKTINLRYLNIDSDVTADSKPTVVINCPETMTVGSKIINNINLTVQASHNANHKFTAHTTDSIFNVYNLTIKNVPSNWSCLFNTVGYRRIFVDKFEIEATAQKSVFVHGCRDITINTVKTSQTITHGSYSGGVVSLMDNMNLTINSFINNTNGLQYLFNRWHSGTNMNVFLKSITCPLGGTVSLPIMEGGFYVQGASINYFFNEAVCENLTFEGTQNYGNYISINGKLKINYSVGNLALFNIYKNFKSVDFRDNYVLKNLEIDVYYPSNPTAALIFFNGADTSTEKSKIILDNLKVRTSHPCHTIRFNSNVVANGVNVVEFRGSNYFDTKAELINSLINPTDSKFIVSRKASIINIFGVLSTNPNILITEL
nr:hypothetical protein [uncultured Flavobacterium sp.]